MKCFVCWGYVNWDIWGGGVGGDEVVEGVREMGRRVVVVREEDEVVGGLKGGEGGMEEGVGWKDDWDCDGEGDV